MLFISIVFTLFNVLSVVMRTSEQDMYANEEEVNQIDSLCDRPYINAADRMANNTVRVYRGDHYWNLKGLPARSGTLDGPYELPFRNMGSIYRNNTVVTLLGGTDRGKTVKTEGKNYWVWDARGNMKSEATGVTHNRFPLGGFEAAIHDGNPDDPTLIGFKGIKVYYFSTRYRVWSIDNMPSGWIGGRSNESFPTDLTAAFSFPADNPKDGYIAYLFKRDKYCKRTKVLKSGKQCDEWLSNTVLFGCEGEEDVQPMAPDGDDNEVPVPVGPPDQQQPGPPGQQQPGPPDQQQPGFGDYDDPLFDFLKPDAGDPGEAQPPKPGAEPQLVDVDTDTQPIVADNEPNVPNSTLTDPDPEPNPVPDPQPPDVNNEVDQPSDPLDQEPAPPPPPPEEPAVPPKKAKKFQKQKKSKGTALTSDVSLMTTIVLILLSIHYMFELN